MVMIKGLGLAGGYEATLAERERALLELRQRVTAAETNLADSKERAGHAGIALARKEHELEVSP